jgi:hypothetical protein
LILSLAPLGRGAWCPHDTHGVLNKIRLSVCVSNNLNGQDSGIDDIIAVNKIDPKDHDGKAANNALDIVSFQSSCLSGVLINNL